MNETVRTEPVAWTQPELPFPVAPASETRSATELPPNFSVGRRFDSPHASPFVRDQVRAASSLTGERPWQSSQSALPRPNLLGSTFPPATLTEVAREPVPPPISREKLLLQASQVAEQLSSQMSELDRREQRLNSQLAQLDHEGRELRGWVQRVEEELREREQSLCEREAACGKRMDELSAIEHVSRETHESVQREHEEVDAARKKLEAELQHERALLENRLRFQQEHLAKTRREVEESRAELAQERQLAHTERQADTETLRLRQRQLDRYRESLEGREESVQRERELLERVSHDTHSQLHQEREKLHAERSAWQQEREHQQSEMQRQQAMLTQHAESLESRHQRIDKLRTDVEETHRQTLEMRLAVEETFSRLTVMAGDDSARSQVEQTRQALLSQYQHVHEALNEQRSNLERWQAQLEQQHAEIHIERQALVDWLAEQESDLRRRSDAVQVERQESASREHAWSTVRDRWLHEKIEAEEVIRELLRRMGTPT